VFLPHLAEAEPALREVQARQDSAFVYASCVLFPETFIYQHQVAILSMVPSASLHDSTLEMHVGPLATCL
jgi:hypothetical protein